MKTPQAGFEWDGFFGELSGPRPRVLLLDYDGTLAPFRVGRDQATPYPEVHAPLQSILRAGRTRVAIISGRALADLIPLLGLEPLPELWGCHGWERRLPDGDYLAPDFEPAVGRALARAHEWVCTAGLEPRCENKPASVAVHWRGMDAAPIERLRTRVCEAWQPLVRPGRLELHEFDGGLELRAAGRDKGYPVAQILRRLEDDAIVAYAGDDRTDEDAFQALSERGLSILVRSEYRQTAAKLWLRPPREWARFLRAWTEAEAEGGSR